MQTTPWNKIKRNRWRIKLLMVPKIQCYVPKFKIKFSYLSDMSTCQHMKWNNIIIFKILLSLNHFIKNVLSCCLFRYLSPFLKRKVGKMKLQNKFSLKKWEADKMKKKKLKRYQKWGRVDCTKFYFQKIDILSCVY